MRRCKYFLRNLFILTLCIIFPTRVQAQPFANLNYQAVVNDDTGQPYEGLVGVRISILQSTPEGEIKYSERHSEETDSKGFLSLKIGEGDEVYKGTLQEVDWADGPSFLRTEIAIGGGYVYSISTTTELVSVPFALYSLKSDTVLSGFVEKDPLFTDSPAAMIFPEDTVRWNAMSKRATHRIGDLYEGGIIFYIEPDGEHGLIASLNDLSTNVPWGSVGTTTSAASSYDGNKNSDQIIAVEGAVNIAVTYCDTLKTGGYEDWYLPSADELHLLFRARYLLNKTMEIDENEETNAFSLDKYWTSTEKDANNAFLFNNGNLSFMLKSQTAAVRAIRSF